MHSVIVHWRPTNRSITEHNREKHSKTSTVQPKIPHIRWIDRDTGEVSSFIL